MSSSSTKSPRRSSAASKGTEQHGYEFGGPLGAFGISFGLPILVYSFAFLCNDISGCPAPSLLSPSRFSLATLKQETGWNQIGGFSGLASWEATGYVLAYYGFNLLLHIVLPGTETLGTELVHGGKLQYKFNAFTSAIFTLSILVAGTLLQGPNFPVWTYIWENYIQIITANMLVVSVLAAFVYIQSFSVKPPSQRVESLRELAAGGHSGNMIYDWFIGRELNPRITIPIINFEIDIKCFCELRPGLLGWLILDLAFATHQYSTYGSVSDSMILICVFQGLYVLDGLWMEPAILTTMDITTDGFGYMLAFGDLVWVPFIYSLQAHYLAVYPVHLGLTGIAGVLAVQGLGYYIFRSSNNEKNRFRTNPSDPRVKHLQFMKTKSGSKLLVSGWWGTARHINYLGDWIMAWSYCLPTGLAGYIIQPNGSAIQSEARGWGTVVTYFYVVYFAVLLIHRELRDEEKCAKKYGADWEEYKRRVRWRILPGIY